ncbi:uracil-DNA glycosylase [Halorubrum ezzemoulense]|jgi:DNA polymerase|uniref:Type-4 uracil-DNA glycosylase n=2 Tax=Halorubrum ezzemoulense TaxID=337243 RepID=A0A256KH34_HALEZ|nr:MULTISPECIES: uracil-DNA glycosylase [Halorubrum]MDB2224517.1 uracil-DNA glycosylase [Halorubrum ezzemoulense]MDB2238857.1 uracil-DNA glycosylase [Halorubrum ezzemoulense]MDB2242476.1 uracil-DNA glycosylase [Halorubrum ezzemoulense]MDB2249640.1 uracil-DNA glycosylase [Halorubrum ezzemoulense]MDB2264806.1 uracil-DNA glycosylase [Halorubrum ezzemoulense]
MSEHGGDGSALDEDLRVPSCERCPALVESRSRIVDGVGPTNADLLFVGEGPGATEDEEGEPFVGRSGDVLDEALRDAGLARADVRITNCVRCRPPDNRDPTTEELANCRGYLEGEIDRLDPELIVTLGKVPSEHLLDRSVAITGESGDVVDARLAGVSRRVLLSVHPAATLYDRSQRDGFFETIARAAELSGVSDRGENGGDGQSRLGEF